jgi:acyl-CoA oxidase
LKIIHHFASGLKSYYTWTVHSNLTMLRECCGGAGFHAYSGLPYLYNEHTAYVAFEGDNTVLIQQCAKQLIESGLKNKVPKKFEFFNYLVDLGKQFANMPIVNKYDRIDSLDAVEDALRVRAAYFVYTSVLRGVAQQKEAGVSSKKLFNELY